LPFEHLVVDDGGLYTGVAWRSGEWELAERPTDNVDAGLARRRWTLNGPVQGGERAEQCDAAAGDDAFFDRRAGGVQGVFDAGLLLLHLRSRCGADVDLGHAAGQLGQPLLELLAVVVEVVVSISLANLIDPALDGL
jgi:hypothetical protein